MATRWKENQDNTAEAVFALMMHQMGVEGKYPLCPSCHGEGCADCQGGGFKDPTWDTRAERKQTEPCSDETPGTNWTDRCQAAAGVCLAVGITYLAVMGLVMLGIGPLSPKVVVFPALCCVVASLTFLGAGEILND